MSDSTAFPTHGPETLRFEGIVEGRTVDSEAIRSAAADMSRATGQRFEVEFDGPTFSILSDDSVQDGRVFDETRRTDFLDALRRVVAGAEPNTVESTLRCTAWFENKVAETVFGIEGGEPRPVGRLRPRGPDEGRMPRPEPAFHARSTSRIRIVSIAIVAVIALGGVAWQWGIPQRMFAAEAKALEVSTGPLNGMIEITAESKWQWSPFGWTYEVRISAGESFPHTPQELDAAAEATNDLIERAALENLQSGGRFEIQLLDDDDEILEKKSTTLVTLLGDADKTVTVELRGHLAGSKIRLALESDD